MMKTHKNMDIDSYKDVHDEKPIRIWIFISTKMRTTKPHNNMVSHSYKDVHNENP